MTDMNDDLEASVEAAQLEQLKIQADLLDIKYAANIGLETLSERIRAHKEKLGDAEATIDTAANQGITANDGDVPSDIEAQYAVFRAKQLVRVSIQCVNPAKADLQSDLYTVYSSSIGRISQVIPYQAPKGYHIPRALVEFLKAKTFLMFKPSNRKKGETGVDREHYTVPEFIINELPPLTPDEFKRIVERQDRQQAVNIDED